VSVQIEEAKLSHANLPRSEHENFESDLRGGRKRLFFEVPQGRRRLQYPGRRRREEQDDRRPGSDQSGSDMGLLTQTAEPARAILEVETIEVVADSGYFKIEDIRSLPPV
jgi:hypothetical protein